MAGYPRPAAEAVISGHRLSGERVCLRLPVIGDQGTNKPIVLTMK